VSGVIALRPARADDDRFARDLHPETIKSCTLTCVEWHDAVQASHLVVRI